ncbi:MAG: phytanoyl-CoA dioxygenase family protein [Woeseiaceae bacterium]|nr:phytanoyl-CoA dioxygenase family protein [Woeseiaceae bacterium]
MSESPRDLPRYAAPEGGQLTDAMIADYAAAGVLVLEDFVTPSACRELKARALQLVEAFDPGDVASVFSTTDEEQLDDRYFIESGDKIRFFLEREAIDERGRPIRSKADSLNKMGHAMHDIDPVFRRFSHTPELAEVARRIGFDDPVIIQSMYIFKPPRIGGEVASHQDSTYLYTEPETCTGFWFALEDATLENGCMQFIPGAHRGPLKRRNYRIGDNRLATKTLDDSPWPEEQRVPVPARAGTLVVFDGRAPHMSAANRSDRSRHAYTLHAIERHARYPASNWLQRTAALPLCGFDAETDR